MIPRRMPARCSSRMPWPSRTSKRLNSSPLPSMTMPPSVKTPSKSSSNSLIFRARCRTEGATRGTALYARFQQVVEVNDTDGLLCAQHEERRDGVLLHDRHRGRGKRVASDRFGARRHQVLRLVAEDVALFLQPAPEIPVGDDADEGALSVHDAGDSEALGGYLEDRLLHRRILAHQRQLGTVVHQLFDAQQELSPERPAGMAQREIFLLEAALFEQHDRQRGFKEEDFALR